MKKFVSSIKKLINCREGDIIRILKNQMAVELLIVQSQLIVFNFKINYVRGIKISIWDGTDGRTDERTEVDIKVRVRVPQT